MHQREDFPFIGFLLFKVGETILAGDITSPLSAFMTASPATLACKNAPARPNLPNHRPADSNVGQAFKDLKELRDKGILTPAQADVFMVPRPYKELYNCTKDPMQLLNVASLPEYQKELTQILWIGNP